MLLTAPIYFFDFIASQFVFMMNEEIVKVQEALNTLKKRKDGQTYENLTEDCMKTHGWDADMTASTIEAAKSRGVVKEKLHNGKLGLRLTEPVIDQKDQRDNESSWDDYADFKKFVCNELQAVKLDCQRGVESTTDCFKDHPFCRVIINNLEARIQSLEKQLQEKQNIIELALNQIPYLYFPFFGMGGGENTQPKVSIETGAY